MPIQLSEYLPSSVGGSLIAIVFATTPSTVHLAKSITTATSTSNNKNNNNNSNIIARPLDASSASSTASLNATTTPAALLFPSANDNFEILSNSPALSGGAIVDLRAPQLPYSNENAPSICSLWQTSGPRGRKCCALVTLSANFDVHVMTCSLDGENILIVFKHALATMSKWLGERSAVFPNPPNQDLFKSFSIMSVVSPPASGVVENNNSSNNSPTNKTKINNNNNNNSLDDDDTFSLTHQPLPRPALSWFSPSTGALFFVPTVPKQSHAPEERIFWFPYTCLRRPIVSADNSGSHLKMKKLYTNFGCPVVYFTVSEDTDTSGGNETVKFSIVAALSAKHTVRIFCVPSVEVVSALESKPNLNLREPIVLSEFNLASVISPIAPNYQLSVPSFLNLEGFFSQHFSSTTSTSSSSSTLFGYALKLFSAPTSFKNLINNRGNDSTGNVSSNIDTDAITSSTPAQDFFFKEQLTTGSPLTADQMTKILALAFSTSNSAHPHIFISSLAHSIGPFSFMRIKTAPRGAAITRELNAAAFSSNSNSAEQQDSISRGWGAQVFADQFIGVGLCVSTDQIVHVLDCFPKKSNSVTSQTVQKFKRNQFLAGSNNNTNGQTKNNSSDSDDDDPASLNHVPVALFRYSIGGGLALPHFLGVPFQVPDWANQRLVSDRSDDIQKARLPSGLILNNNNLLSSSSSSSNSSSTAAPPARRVMFVVSKSNDQPKENHSSYHVRVSNMNTASAAAAERNSSNWKYLCLCADNELHEAVGVLVPFSGYPSAKIVSRNFGKSPLQRILFAPLESLSNHDQQVLFLHAFDPVRDRHLIGNRHNYNSNVRIAPAPASESHPRLDKQTGKIERPVHAAYLFLGKDLNLQMGQSAASRCVLFVGVSSVKVPEVPRQVTPSTNHFCIFARQMNELDSKLLQAQQEQATLNLFKRNADPENHSNDPPSSLASYISAQLRKQNKKQQFLDANTERQAAEIDSTFPVNSGLHGKVERAVVDFLSWNTAPFVQYEESKGSVTLLSVDIVDPLINVNSNIGNNNNNNTERTVFYFVRFAVTEEGEDGSMKLGRESCLILVCSVVVHAANFIQEGQKPKSNAGNNNSINNDADPTSVTLKNGAKLSFTNPDFKIQVFIPDHHHHHHQNSTVDHMNEDQVTSSDDEDEGHHGGFSPRDKSSSSSAAPKQSSRQKKQVPVELKFSLRLRRIVNLSDVAVTITDHVVCFKRTRCNEFFSASTGRNGNSSPELGKESNDKNVVVGTPTTGNTANANTNFPAWQVLDLRAFDSSSVIPPVKIEEESSGGSGIVKTDKVVEISLARLYSSPWQDSFEESVVKALSCCSSVSRVFHQPPSAISSNDENKSNINSSPATSTKNIFSDLYDGRGSKEKSSSSSSSSNNSNNASGANISFHQLFVHTVKNPNVIASFPGTLVLAWSATARCLFPILTVYQRNNGICCSFPFLLRQEKVEEVDAGGRYVGFVRPTLPKVSQQKRKPQLPIIRKIVKKTVKEVKDTMSSIFADDDGYEEQVIIEQQQPQSENTNDSNLAPSVQPPNKRTIPSSISRKNSAFLSLCSPTMFQEGNNNNNQNIINDQQDESFRSVSGTTFLSDAVIIPQIFGERSFAVVAATGNELTCVAFWGFTDASPTAADTNRMFVEDHILDIFEQNRGASATNGGIGSTIVNGEIPLSVASLFDTFRGETKTMWSFNPNVNSSTYCAPIMQLSAGQSSSSSSSGYSSTSNTNTSASASTCSSASEGPSALFVVALLTNGVVRCHGLTTGAILWQLGTGASLPMIVRAESAASVLSGSSVCTLPDIIDFCGISDAPSKSHWVLARIGSLFPSLGWRPEPASSVLFSWLEWIQWCVSAVVVRNRRLANLRDPPKAIISEEQQKNYQRNLQIQQERKVKEEQQKQRRSALLEQARNKKQKQQHVDPNSKKPTAVAAVDLLDDIFAIPSSAPAVSSTNNNENDDNNNEENNNENNNDDADEINTPLQQQEEVPSFEEVPQMTTNVFPCNNVNHHNNYFDEEKSRESSMLSSSQAIQRIFLCGLVATLRTAGEAVNVARSVINKCRIDEANPISTNLENTKFVVVPTAVAAILATMNLPMTALAMVETNFPSVLFDSSISQQKNNNRRNRNSHNSNRNATSGGFNSSSVFDNLFSSTPSLANYATCPQTHIFSFATIAFWLDFNGNTEEATVVSLYVLKLLTEFTKDTDSFKLPMMREIDTTLSILLLMTLPTTIAGSLNLFNFQNEKADNLWTKYSLLHRQFNSHQQNASNVASSLLAQKPKDSIDLARLTLLSGMNMNGVNHLWELICPDEILENVKNRKAKTVVQQKNAKSNNDADDEGDAHNHDEGSGITGKHDSLFGSSWQPTIVSRQKNSTSLLANLPAAFSVPSPKATAKQALFYRFKANVGKAFGQVASNAVDAACEDLLFTINNNTSSSSSSSCDVITLKEIATCGQQGVQFVADLDSRLLKEAIALDKKYQEAYESTLQKEKELFMSSQDAKENDGKAANVKNDGPITQAEAHAAFANHHNKKSKKNQQHDDDDERGNSKLTIGGGGGGLSSIQIQIVEDSHHDTDKNNNSNITADQKTEQLSNATASQNNGNLQQPQDQQRNPSQTFSLASSTNNINNNNKNAGNSSLDATGFQGKAVAASAQAIAHAVASTTSATSTTNRLVNISRRALDDENLGSRVRKQVPHHDAAFSSDAENEARLSISSAIVKAAEQHLLSNNFAKVLQAAAKLKNGVEMGDNCAMMQLFLVARVLKLAKMERALKKIGIIVIVANQAKVSSNNNENGQDDHDVDDEDDFFNDDVNSSQSNSFSSPSFSDASFVPKGESSPTTTLADQGKLLACDLVRATALLNSSCLSNSVLGYLCEKLLPFYIESKCAAAATQLMGLYRLTVESQIESGALSNEEATQRTVQAEQRVGAIDGLDGGELEGKILAALDGKVVVCVDSLSMMESSKVSKCFKCMSLYERKCVCV